MASAAKSICRHAGCGVLIHAPGRCDKHKKQVQVMDAAARGTAHERGYTSAWVKARAGYLAKHPLCLHCMNEGRVVAASVVDHIINHKLKAAMDSGDATAIAKAKALFWDSDGNWQPLCKTHHDIKTATEDGAFGRRVEPKP